MLFRKLFEPLQIGSLVVKNRLVMPAMHNNLGDPQEGISAQGADFYVARAKGGFGLISVGIIDTHPWDYSSPHELFLTSDDHIRAHADVVRRAHSFGAVVAAQIGVRRMWKLSDLRKGATVSMFDEALVEQMVQEVVETGIRAAKAGYDAIELLGTGGSGISMFLSKVFNDRTDRWGGDVEGRARFPVEMVKGIRSQLGEQVPIFFRLHGAEFLPGGYGLEESREIAGRLEAAGVGFFNVTGGSHATSVPQLTPDVPHGTYAFLAREIRRAVGVPVAASNRITHPFEAEEILRKGWADCISLGRGSLADPEWPNKAQSGDYDRIRRCIACNECFDYTSIYEQPIRCLVNPQAGRMSEMVAIEPAVQSKKVIVIGGGCTGLQAALTAAQRGHRVVLYEREPVLGGRWRVAYAPPGRGELFHFIDWLVREVRLAGVDVRLGQEATPENIAQEKADMLLVSAGGHPIIPEIPGVDMPHVHLAEAVLEGNVAVGSQIVVVGGGGVGVETSLFLARRNYVSSEAHAFLQENQALLLEATEAYSQAQQSVVLVGRNSRIGKGLGPGTRWVLRKELDQDRVEVLTEAAVEAIDSDTVWVTTSEGRRAVPCDTVVLAVGYAPDPTVLECFQGLAAKVVGLGDIEEVNHALSAVGRAFELAMEL